MHAKERFAFGKNWNAFLKKHFSEASVAASQQALCAFLGLPSLAGFSFLDVGCGSGLSSLAALRAGAEMVVSFDFDPDSVRAAQTLHDYAGSPKNWRILRGDALDPDFLQSLGKFDIVYSWGVLHHTGDMRAAVANTVLPVSANGLLFLALYSYTAYQNNQVFGQPSPEEWLGIKLNYLRGGPWRRGGMILWYIWRRYFFQARGNPRKLAAGLAELCSRWRHYGAASRGMNFLTDIHDWLGGWPMEFVHEAEFVRDMRAELSMELLRMDTGRGNTEFLFRPAGCSNVWNARLATRAARPLPGPFEHIGGAAWRAALPELSALADTDQNPMRSPLRLQEDGQWLCFAHCHLPSLERFGLGRYRHRGDSVFFSSSDNSNPNTNGRRYSYLLDER